jgi:hypothetical protein
VEAAHAFIKRFLAHSQGDLLTTWLSIEKAIANQIRTITYDLAKERIRIPLDLDRHLYQACFGIITTPALRLV